MTGRTLLVHRTCEHSAAQIRWDGVVLPNSPYGDPPVSWWSDLSGSDATIRAGLGLTSNLLHCDRMAYTFAAVLPAEDRPFIRYASKAGRALISRELRRGLDLAPGAAPAHWWLAIVPIRVQELHAPTPEALPTSRGEARM